MRSIINHEYLHLRDFLLALPERFDELECDEVLHTGRNEVRLFTVAGVRIVVKNFARISRLNRVVYGLLRPSKAVRAYSYAQQLNAREEAFQLRGMSLRLQEDIKHHLKMRIRRKIGH
jgi:hypothetical protein